MIASINGKSLLLSKVRKYMEGYFGCFEAPFSGPSSVQRSYRERIFIELMPSDRKLKASREGYIRRSEGA